VTEGTHMSKRSGRPPVTRPAPAAGDLFWSFVCGLVLGFLLCMALVAHMQYTPPPASDTWRWHPAAVEG
jgi:hypothetical protein